MASETLHSTTPSDSILFLIWMVLIVSVSYAAGPVVRFAPDGLSFNSTAAYQAIYGFKANNRKADFYLLFSPPGHPSVFNDTDKEAHAKKRKVLSYAFSDKAMRNMEEYMLQHVRTFCAKIGTSKAVNVATWTEYLSFDIMGELAFGQTLGMLIGSSNRYVLDLIVNSAHYCQMSGLGRTFHNLGLGLWVFPKLMGDKAKFRVFSHKYAGDRINVAGDRKDFYHYLLKATDKETGERFGVPELVAQANVIIIGGAETTATGMAALFFYLTHDARALAKVTKEVRGTFAGQNVEAIRSGAALSSCHYLRACIDEAMRCSPPIPGILPRKVLPGGMNIDGYEIPPGVDVGVSAYVLHHNPDVFPEPFEYRPERWMPSDNNTKRDMEPVKSSFAAFSIGPRSCVGMPLGYMEMMITAARVLFQFDLKLASDLGEGSPESRWGRRRKGEFQIQDNFVANKDGPIVEFTPAHAN
ncbi:hypothetical protein VMCG_04172 [Cytospora schulzeri]|uniref:Uncharacterized protein n=1 Tax=Cytospora schulzeri TaxID=448051 RepID=A0A423WTP1_9PEZI|nr:hypothetical protein VMCG_04172 [Valsa malicola]